jgi:two-component system sensor histidine kinase KdpD
VAILAGVSMVALMSLLSAVLAVRAVSRRLELARLRAELVASISHELRTPLTSMLVNLELLDDPRLAEADRSRSTRRALSSAERLKSLVDRVLDFTRAQHRDEPLERTAVAVSELLAAALEEMKNALGGRRVIQDLEPGLPKVLVHRDSMVEVLAGLIDNSLKYAGHEGPLTLRAAPRDRRRVLIEVEDRGPGVPETERAHLFEPFFRSSRTAGKTQGVGLGLALARGLVEEQGGRVRAEATEPGADPEGLRIVIELPIAAGDPAHSSARPEVETARAEARESETPTVRDHDTGVRKERG